MGSTIGDILGTGGDTGVALWEMYQVNNLTSQVANCVLKDFVAGPILYNIFRPLFFDRTIL